jgi:hypothetical protein
MPARQYDPSFFIVTSKFNGDQAAELRVRLLNFGFVDVGDSYDPDVELHGAIKAADVVIVILPGDNVTDSVLEVSRRMCKIVILVGHECDVDYTNSYNYENVFSINEVGKSAEVIYKHLSELQNVYSTEELE